MAKNTGITKSTRKVGKNGRHVSQYLPPKSGGTQIQPIPDSPRFVDRRGQRFGKLVVIGYVGRVSKVARWLTLCGCGQTSVATSSNLPSGKTRSCGSRACRSETRSMADGYATDPIYAALANAKARCENPQHPSYARYGLRGIEFRLGPLSEAAARVREHLGPRPEGWVLDRVCNSGHYELANLRWAPPKTSVQNRDVTVWIEIFGERWALADVARAFGVPYARLHQRIAKGWHPQIALSTPRRVRRPNAA